MEGDLDDWKSLGACCAAASSSFIRLPAASYSHHEAIAMRATRELVISTEWKEVQTVGKSSELLHCASSSFLCGNFCGSFLVTVHHLALKDSDDEDDNELKGESEDVEQSDGEPAIILIE